MALGIDVIDGKYSSHGLLNQLMLNEKNCKYCYYSVPFQTIETLVSSLNNSILQGVLTFDIVKGSIFYEEGRNKECRESLRGACTEYHGRNTHNNFNTRDKSRGELRDKFRGRSRKRRDVECYCCHEKRHINRE